MALASHPYGLLHQKRKEVLLPKRHFQIKLKRSIILIENFLYCHHTIPDRKLSAFFFPHLTDIFPLFFLSPFYIHYPVLMVHSEYSIILAEKVKSSLT